MKPLYLKFHGIKSFSDWAEIDFQRLLSGGIFGIFGDTGAGKSTILDSIGFVLYGKINCIGKEGTTMSDILNFHSDKGEVIFDFESECNGKRSSYRIERSINKKGLQKATLYEVIDDKTIAIAEGPSQVNKKIEEEIVGIGFDDFKKCIALPQGEFSEFLRSGRKERLELISKLFALDEYGSVLVRRVNSRISIAESKKNTLEGKLSNYLEVSAEAIEVEQGREQVLRAEREVAERIEREKTQLLQTAERSFTVAQELKKAKQELEMLSMRREEMEFLKSIIERLRVCKRICEIEEERLITEKNRIASEENEKRLFLVADRVKSEIDRTNSDMGATDYDQKIEKAQIDLTKREAAQKDIDRLHTVEKELKEVIAQYRTAKSALATFDGFDYEVQKSELTRLRAQLPKEDNFLDFINANFKSILLTEEQKTFVKELQTLTEKYPVIISDTTPLIEKYSRAEGKGKQNGKVVDIASQAEYFKKASEKKRAIDKQLFELEVDRVKYIAALQEEARLKENGARVRKEVDSLNASLQDVRALGEMSELSQKLERLKTEKREEQKRLDGLKEKLSVIERNISAEQAKKKSYLQIEQNKLSDVQSACKENGFESSTECSELLKKYGTAERVQLQTEQYFNELLRVEISIKNLKNQVDVGTMSVTSEELSQMKADLIDLRGTIKSLHGQVALCAQNVERLQKDLQIKTELQTEFTKIEHDLSMLQKLRELVGKDKFMEFIAVEYLQDVASGANNLLTKLTGGRYFLTYGDKNFEVGDNYNGGQTRGVHTLSGGEVFLVSLSLALSLSEMIHCKSLRPIEFFFLDEGFGTLDDELVDVVMNSLEKLKSDHFSIGVISHVGELKNRLENKIIVKKANEECGSSVEIY